MPKVALISTRTLPFGKEVPAGRLVEVARWWFSSCRRLRRGRPRWPSRWGVIRCRRGWPWPWRTGSPSRSEIFATRTGRPFSSPTTLSLFRFARVTGVRTTRLGRMSEWTILTSTALSWLCPVEAIATFRCVSVYSLEELLPKVPCRFLSLFSGGVVPWHTVAVSQAVQLRSCYLNILCLYPKLFS